jgi:hypothetical protein
VIVYERPFFNRSCHNLFGPRRDEVASCAMEC